MNEATSTPSNSMPEPITELDVPIRVRYTECDPMSVAHHATYPVWLEIARTELLRVRGVAYKDLEAAGVLFVVVRMSLRYRKPAYYGDQIVVRVRSMRCEPPPPNARLASRQG